LIPVSYFIKNTEFSKYYVDTMRSLDQSNQEKANAFVEQFVANNYLDVKIPIVEGNLDGEILTVPNVPEINGHSARYVKYKGIPFKYMGDGTYHQLPVRGKYVGTNKYLQWYDFNAKAKEFNSVPSEKKYVPTLQTENPVVPSQEKVMQSNNPSEFTNYSGAALGSDQEWEKVGKEFGVGKQVNYTVNSLDKLTPDQMKEVETAYLKAAEDLGRKSLDAGSYSGKLVRRDYLQAKAADSIFAIGTILKPGDRNKKGYSVRSKTESVDGGTGYAVQMGINLGKPVYVFDQSKGQWFSWNGTSFTPTETPTLTPKFAGIGTRELTDTGKTTIREVYSKTFTQEKVMQPTVVKGEEISSYSDNLAFALTNPVFTSPTGQEWKREWKEGQKKWREHMKGGIIFEGKKWRDTEQAYQKNKERFPVGEARNNFMLELIEIKLRTYPKLVEGIDAKGGVDYLKNSTHQPTKKNSDWETGGKNMFIKLLTQAYMNVKGLGRQEGTQMNMFDQPRTFIPTITNQLSGTEIKLLNAAVDMFDDRYEMDNIFNLPSEIFRYSNSDLLKKFTKALSEFKMYFSPNNPQSRFDLQDFVLKNNDQLISEIQDYIKGKNLKVEEKKMEVSSKPITFTQEMVDRLNEITVDKRTNGFVYTIEYLNNSSEERKQRAIYCYTTGIIPGK